MVSLEKMEISTIAKGDKLPEFTQDANMSHSRSITHTVFPINIHACFHSLSVRPRCGMY